MPFLHDPEDARLLLDLAGDGTAHRLAVDHVARALRERGVHTLGLIPADDDAAVPPVAVHLARALVARGAASAAILDASGSWCSGDPAADAPDGVLVTRIDPDLALISPRRHAPGRALGRVRGIVAKHGPSYAHLLVDLTGFDRLGEEPAACDLLDATIIVVRSGRTRAPRLVRRARGIPDERFLGALLVGVAPRSSR